MLRRFGVFVTALMVVLAGLAVSATPALAFFGVYQIKPYGTNKCLDVTDVSYNNGAYLQLYDCLGGTQYNQAFYLVSVAGYSDRYQIKASHSLKCLDVKDMSQDPAARLQQWDCLGASQTNQVFYVGYAGSGKYMISPSHSWQDVTYQGLFNGAAVYQWFGTITYWSIV